MSRLNVDQVVNIDVYTAYEKKSYNSKVVATDEQKIALLAPMDRGTVISLQPGTKLVVSYSDDTAVYTFETKVIEQRGVGGKVILVEPPEFQQRTQRRNFVRLDLNLSLGFVIMNDDYGDYATQEAGKTLDLSGGGMRFVTTKQVSLGDSLDVSINLEDQGNVNAFGKVVRCTPHSKPGLFVIGLQFTIIDEKDRDKVIKFIFQKQRELRQRGLI